MSYGCFELGLCSNSTVYGHPAITGGITPSNTQGSSKSGVSFSPLVISLIVILGFAFILISYYTIFSKYCISLGSRMREGRGRRSSDDMLVNEVSVPMITQGLQDSVVKSIPVFKYSKADGLVDGTDCAVCLSEFEENVSLRLLPKCSHAFHISCIDKWLQSHSNCPLCRANVVSTAQPISVTVQISNEHRGVAGISEESSESPLQEVPLLTGNSTTHEQAPRNTSVEGFLYPPRIASDSEQLAEVDGDYPQCWGRRLDPFTHEERLFSRDPDKFLNQFGVLHLGHMRSVSMDFDFNNSWFDRRLAHFSGHVLCFGRSHSTGSFSVNPRIEFSVNPGWNQNTASASRLQEASNRVDQTTINIKDQPTCTVSEDPSSAGSCRVVDILGFDSLDNPDGNQSFKSKSFSYAINLSDNAKADAVNPSRGKMISLKRPLGLKRSLSGGRIFGFMTAGKARNTSGDVDTRSILRPAP